MEVEDSLPSYYRIALHLRRRAAIGQYLWSVAHHGTAFAAVLFSLSAAIFAGRPDLKQHVPVVSAIAAAVSAIAASNGLAQKWRTNRLIKGRLDCWFLDANLLLENDEHPSATPPASPPSASVTPQQLVEELKKIITTLNDGIVSAEK